MALQPGLTYTSTLTVTENHTAKSVGSGDLDVLATPIMTALMENAAMLAVAEQLQEGDTTVGGQIESSHLKPSPIGSNVTATAILTKVEGRKLFFDITARQGENIIGGGTHLRYIVNREKFMQKCK
jgi:fluoroacetyl-CoA thioesterase